MHRLGWASTFGLVDPKLLMVGRMSMDQLCKHIVWPIQDKKTLIQYYVADSALKSQLSGDDGTSRLSPTNFDFDNHF